VRKNGACSSNLPPRWVPRVSACLARSLARQGDDVTRNCPLLRTTRRLAGTQEPHCVSVKDHPSPLDFAEGPSRQRNDQFLIGQGVVQQDVPRHQERICESSERCHPHVASLTPEDLIDIRERHRRRGREIRLSPTP
jgi:hypothetical protein